MQKVRGVVFGKKTDWLFVVFPIWIPIAFYLVVNGTSLNQSVLLFSFFVLVGESHFLATLFFFTKSNFEYINSHKTIFYHIPVFLVIFNVGLFTISPSYALLLGGALSAFHVTRQSIGVFRLYQGRNKLAETSIYAFSLIFVFIGFLRTVERFDFKLLSDFRVIQYLNEQTSKNSFVATILLLALLSLIILLFKFQEIFCMEGFGLLTLGMMMYSPYLYADPALAATLGVSMHWVQYLSLVIGVSVRTGFKFREVIFKYKVIVLVVAITAIVIADFAKTVNNTYLGIFVVPLTIQLLHYYYDGRIWKGSDPYLRENVLKKVFK